MTSTRALSYTASCAAQRALAIVATLVASTMRTVVVPPRSQGPGRP